MANFSNADLCTVLGTLSLGEDPAGGINPLQYLPCANHDVAKAWACPNVAVSSCSVCHLVSYCSKDCQSTHWPLHKRDCKDPLLSQTWLADWEAQQRTPSFRNDNTHMQNLKARANYGQNRHMWGNLPAIDLLNLEKNEGKNSNADLKLAFVASGDLRDVVHTVNQLPETYTGKLTILLNDKDIWVTARNLLLLLVLGKPAHDNDNARARAAELALHLWYSAFVQASHATALVTLIMSVAGELKKPTFRVPLGTKSSLAGSFEADVIPMALLALLTSTYDFEQAQKEYQRVFLSAAREDLWHRRYVDMEPEHRMAYDSFRRFGLVLPFGAPNAHFNLPNRFLFSRECEWFLYDGANPLEGWDVDAVMAAGKANGIQRADLYGALYFYLSRELHAFATRLSVLDVSIHMLSADAQSLPAGIRQGAHAAAGIPRSVVFDRIDVSNIVDQNYVGVRGVLAAWGPWLDRGNRCATLVGSFMNWVMAEPNAAPEGMGVEAMAKWIKSRVDHAEISLATIFMKGRHNTTIYNAIYDNSAAFVAYLNKQQAAHTARAVKLRLKSTHTIVPHRTFARLSDPSDATPYLPNAEAWYWKVYLSGHSFTSRHVEFGPA